MNSLFIPKYITDNYIIHNSETSWGNSIMIMEKLGRSFGRIYKYDDDPKTFYLESLSVLKDFRNIGLGTEMIGIQEKLSFINSGNKLILGVLRDSWIYSWYIKIGYIYYSENIEDSDLVWMIKEIDSPERLIYDERRKI